ncbi:ADP-ribosylglycohydrolase family protein [Candidatus Woesearchaeota archaeon]|nr:ADP-ribosylglycohydrolase family protein [Candidatus Woesearchaeota archaeon]
MPDMRERYRAVLVGCAIGDILGKPVEGWKKEQIEKHVGRITEPVEPFVLRDGNGKVVRHDEFGKLKYFAADAGMKAGDYTDDTILTLALAEAIAECKGLDLGHIAGKQLAEYVQRLLPDGRSTGGFGYTTIRGFRRLMEGFPPEKSGVVGAPGNAPAMKMSPVGMYMDATGECEKGLQYAGLTGRITHLDPRSVASGVVQAHAIYGLLQDIPRNDFVSSLTSVCRRYEMPLGRSNARSGSGSLSERVEWVAASMDAEAADAHRNLGSSSLVFSSYPFALFMLQKYWDNPVEGLVEVVNFGGDTDTTGAIYGALAGAKNGMVFPESWIRQVSGLERLVSAADRIYELKAGR